MRTSDGATAPACPVCGASAQRNRELPSAFLASALEEFVEATMPAGLVVRDYAMCRCPGCTLEFAEPMAAADDAFYGWLDREMGYYLENRWEWDRVEAIVRSAPAGATVLEYGAGDGKLLQRLRAAGAKVAAIERSDEAAARLRALGIEAHAPAQAAALAGRRFDFVLAFHCVEHVPDPLGLAREMLAAAGEDGRVLFSVPYSPMYFETHWFDPLNHPPHHLTRWNARALARLAEAAGAVARLELPEAYRPLARARYALAIERLGPRWMRGRRWRGLPFRHPLRFARHVLEQGRRERVDGRPAADVVLVDLARARPQAGRRATTT